VDPVCKEILPSVFLAPCVASAGRDGILLSPPQQSCQTINYMILWFLALSSAFFVPVINISLHGTGTPKTFKNLLAYMKFSQLKKSF
jgi:hypothetical protein